MTRKNKNTSRNPRVEYKKQQSYHYSSRRSVNDRVFNRQQISIEGEKQKTNKFNFASYLPSYIAILLFLIGLYYLFTLSTKPKIFLINNNAKTQLINIDVLQSKVEGELKKSITNRLKPTFNEDKLEQEIMKLSPEITGISVEVGVLKHNPQIYVEFSEPSILLSTGSNLFIVGSDGRVLADITKNRDGFNVDNLPLVQDQANVEISVGKKALTTDQIDFIQEINYQTSQKGINTSSMIIQSGGSQLDVKYAGLNYFVKYNFFENPRESSGVFMVVKEKLEAEGQLPKEYIDVRVPERAYVK